MPIPKKQVRIYLLLVEGHSHSKIAKLVNCTEGYVRKIATIYVRKKLLQKINNYPAMYQSPKIRTTHTYLGGDSYLPHINSINLPHRFGISFHQIGKPQGARIKYNIKGMAMLEAPDHTIRFGKYKAVIWLKHFIGRSPDEIIENGRKQAEALAEKYMKEYPQVNLEFDRIYQDIEWVKVSKQASKAQAKREKIRAGEQRIVAGAIHKYESLEGSHPKHIEYNALPEGDKTIPTEHARIDHYVYGGQFVKDISDIKTLMGGFQEYNKNIKLHLEVLTEIKKSQHELVKTLKGLKR